MHTRTHTYTLSLTHTNIHEWAYSTHSCIEQHVWNGQRPASWHTHTRTHNLFCFSFFLHTHSFFVHETCETGKELNFVEMTHSTHTHTLLCFLFFEHAHSFPLHGTYETGKELNFGEMTHTHTSHTHNLFCLPFFLHTHSFFVHDTFKTGKELNFGETPLGFAACTNQKVLLNQRIHLWCISKEANQADDYMCTYVFVYTHSCVLSIRVGACTNQKVTSIYWVVTHN